MTMQEVFGDSPWITDPVPGVTSPRVGFQAWNPIYFATKKTANIVAEVLGGEVEEVYTITWPHTQNMPNQMVRMPVLEDEDEGRLINAGIVADIFNHNHSQKIIDETISDMIGFVFTWPM